MQNYSFTETTSSNVFVGVNTVRIYIKGMIFVLCSALTGCTSFYIGAEQPGPWDPNKRQLIEYGVLGAQPPSCLV